jgi:hypothetical protein
MRHIGFTDITLVPLAGMRRHGFFFRLTGKIRKQFSSRTNAL